jgi:hypothetical protein
MPVGPRSRSLLLKIELSCPEYNFVINEGVSNYLGTNVHDDKAVSQIIPMPVGPRSRSMLLKIKLFLIITRTSLSFKCYYSHQCT